MSSRRDSIVRKLVKSGAFLFFGLVFELVVSFLAKVIIANALGQFNYGSVALGVTILAFSSTLVILGLNTGVGRYLPRSDDLSERRGIIISGLQLFLPPALLLGVVITVFAPTIATVGFGEPSMAPVLRVFGPAIPLAAFINYVVGCGQGQQTATPKVVIRNVTLPLFRFGGIAVALTVCGAGVVCSDLLGVSYAYLVSYVVAACLALYYLLRYTPALEFDTPAVLQRRELFMFSLPLVITAAMTHVFSDLDTLMIGYFETPAEVGIYQVVYPLGELLTMTLVAFRFIFIPIVSELDATDERAEMHRLYKIITKWVTMITLPLFLVLALFPRLAINLTFGAEYNGGALALSVLAVGFFIHTVAGLNSGALTSIGKTRLIMYDNIFIAAVNVVLNLLLIPRFSFLGAAVATLLSYTLLNLLYSVQLYAEAGIQPFSTALLRPVGIALVLVGIIYVGARRLLVVDAVALVGLGILFAVTYFFIIVRFGGIEEEEIMLVMSFEERFGVDIGPLKRVGRWLLPE